MDHCSGTDFFPTLKRRAFGSYMTDLTKYSSMTVSKCYMMLLTCSTCFNYLLEARKLIIFLKKLTDIPGLLLLV